MQDFVEYPDSLWLRDHYNSDFVSAESIAQKQPQNSLYFIKPCNLSIKIYWWQKPRLKAVFVYNNYPYELQITDPIVWEFFDNQLVKEGEPDKELKLPYGDDYYLCVSLGSMWKGRHYKLVATIIGTNGKILR